MNLVIIGKMMGSTDGVNMTTQCQGGYCPLPGLKKTNLMTRAYVPEMRVPGDTGGCDVHIPLPRPDVRQI